MRSRQYAFLLLVTALAFVLTVAAQVFLADIVRPRSQYATLLASSVLTGLASMAIGIEVPA